MGSDGYLKVPEGWTAKPLIECTEDQSISYGIVQPGSYVEDGIPIVRVNNFTNGALDTTSVLRVAPIIEEKYSRTRLKGGEVLLTLVGSTGQSTVAPDNLRGWNVPRAIAVIRPDKAIGARWINICLQSHATKSFLDAHANTTVQKTLNLKDVRQIPILVPPDSTKRFIESIISTLDDKIELNRRMNVTLEGMAQALFKSWFLDFDPVIDKALAAGHPIPESLYKRAEVRRALGEKRKPLPAAIEERFPDRFVFSEEMGWVPEGWEIRPLGGFLDVFETGRRPKGGVAKYNSGIPSVGAESINGIGHFDFGKTKFVPEEFFDKMRSGKVNSHDVLLYKDGGKPGDFRPRIGMYGNGFPFDSFGINEHVFRMRSERLGQPFLYFQVGSRRVFHHLAVRGGKAAIPGINQTEVKSVAFLIPPIEIVNKFNEFTFSLINMILNNALKSQTLVQCRDTLLPKLLSGQLNIPDVEKFMGSEL